MYAFKPGRYDRYYQPEGTSLRFNAHRTNALAWCFDLGTIARAVHKLAHGRETDEERSKRKEPAFNQNVGSMNSFWSRYA